MDERQANHSSTPHNKLFELALDQLAEDARAHDKAVRSFNTHLENHRERRDLHEVPIREPVTAHEAFEPALEGDREAIESLLDDMIDRAHLDSAVRRHPRVYPIHLEAVEHLEIARDQLVSTLEASLRHLGPD